MIRVKHKVRV
jgi:hypothetical protein